MTKLTMEELKLSLNDCIAEKICEAEGKDWKNDNNKTMYRKCVIGREELKKHARPIAEVG